MTVVYLTKTSAGLAPSDADAADWFAKLKLGAPINVEAKQMRNGKYHRKFFAMLNTAYANHEWPEVQTQWGPATVTFDLFRQYVTVKAGHYEAALTPHGEVRAQPKSISWAKMDEAEFEQLYSDVLDVILREFLTNWTAGDMESAVRLMMGFC